MSLPIKDLKARCFTVLIRGGFCTAEYIHSEACGSNRNRFSLLDVITALKRWADDGTVAVTWSIHTGCGRPHLYETLDEAVFNLGYLGLAPAALTPRYRWIP